MLRVPLGKSPSASWMVKTLQHAAEESRAPRAGSDTVLAKLSELLFVEAVRACIATLPPDRTGWLAGLRDPHVGRALALLHGRVAHAWSVEELAREVGLSRSVLGERFAALLGEPPMRYLGRWRMQLASLRLRESDDSIARIAADVGYDSEAAFHRAFKRELGVPPAAWRRHSRGPTSAPRRVSSDSWEGHHLGSMSRLLRRSSDEEETVSEESVRLTDIDARRLQSLIEGFRPVDLRDAASLALLERHVEQAEVLPVPALSTRTSSRWTPRCWWYPTPVGRFALCR